MVAAADGCATWAGHGRVQQGLPTLPHLVRHFQFKHGELVHWRHQQHKVGEEVGKDEREGPRGGTPAQRSPCHRLQRICHAAGGHHEAAVLGGSPLALKQAVEVEQGGAKQQLAGVAEGKGVGEQADKKRRAPSRCLGGLHDHAGAKGAQQQALGDGRTPCSRSEVGTRVAGAWNSRRPPCRRRCTATNPGQAPIPAPLCCPEACVKDPSEFAGNHRADRIAGEPHHNPQPSSLNPPGPAFMWCAAAALKVVGRVLDARILSLEFYRHPQAGRVGRQCNDKALASGRRQTCTARCMRRLPPPVAAPSPKQQVWWELQLSVHRAVQHAGQGLPQLVVLVPQRKHLRHGHGHPSLNHRLRPSGGPRLLTAASPHPPHQRWRSCPEA